MRELDRLKCVQSIIDGEMKPGRAAERLGLSVRQIERFVIRDRAEGPIGLISSRLLKKGLSRQISGCANSQVIEIS
jgi:hypothetical protein